MPWIFRPIVALLAVLVAAGPLSAAGDNGLPRKPGGKAVVVAKAPSSSALPGFRRAAMEAGAPPPPVVPPPVLECSDPASPEIPREAPSDSSESNRAPPV